MKPITQERILKALEKSSEYLAKKPETQIYTVLSETGMRSLLGDANPVTDRDRLELAYHGFLDPDQIGKRLSRIAPDLNTNMSGVEVIKNAWFSAFWRVVNKDIVRSKKILDIQEKHNISSLEKVAVKLGEVTIEYHEQIEGLRQTFDDFSVLDSERGRITRRFLNAVRKTQKHLWIHKS